MDRNRIVKIKNRSSGTVVYRIPENNIRREFAAGEEKRVTFDELEKLSFIPGGQALMNEYLQIIDEDVTQDLNIPTQPEYYMSEAQVKDLLLNGNMDEFLDCLDYAPQGVLDLIKDLSVKLPVRDMEKSLAIKEKLGFDCGAAIHNLEQLAQADKEIQVNNTPAPTRRTSGSKYKVVSNK